MMVLNWTRRGVLAGLGALPCAAYAGESPFAQAFDKAKALPQLNALVIAQKGKVVAAEALRGPSLTTPVNVKSVSKSLISALTGIAVQRGEIADLDAPVAPLIGRQVPRRADPRVKKITLRHMLTMRSGLQEVSGAAYGDWVNSKFWIYDALSKPMVADPGAARVYSTASYHVLGAILSAASGLDLHALANQRLGQPLGIDFPPWTRDPQGRYLGGNDMRISALDMITFGELYRNGGLHEGQRVLTQDWVDQGWQVTGHSDETGHGYGFGWFLWDVAGTRVAYARGFGGQMIFIAPQAELTVAMTSNPGLEAPLDGHLGALFDLFADQILGAA